MILGHDLSFWIAIVGAIAIKMVTSETHSLKRAVTVIVAAVFTAWAFTDAILHWLQLARDTYQIPVAALLALTGESIMRMLMSVKTFSDLAAAVNILRGKGKR